MTTRTIARFIAETKYEDIPPEIIEHAKVAFLDWVGVTLAGTGDPLVKKLLDYAELIGGNKQASILGHGIKKSLSHAALINGAASHALDYDDTMMAFVGHPSVTMFPGLLALSEFKEKTGRDFLNAYLIGFKVGAVIGSCAGMEHYMAGWHSTATLGHFTSVAVCSSILGLTEEQVLTAIGIAGTQASGLRRSFGTMCKPFHAGKASHDGLLAALLASKGFTASTDILEGAGGFFDVFKGKIDDDIVGTLGKTWDIESLAQKYHASCHGTHSSIEAALTILEKEGMDVKDIASINAIVSPLSLSAASKTEPKTGLEGKFSINYCVANALLRGNTGTQAFTDDMVNDPEVQELTARISVSADDTLSQLGSRVEIKTKSGDVYSEVTDIMEEIPELEGKRTRISNKFKDLCNPILGDKKAADLVDKILSLEKINNMKDLVEELDG